MEAGRSDYAFIGELVARARPSLSSSTVTLEPWAQDVRQFLPVPCVLRCRSELKSIAVLKLS